MRTFFLCDVYNIFRFKTILLTVILKICNDHFIWYSKKYLKRNSHCFQYNVWRKGWIQNKFPAGSIPRDLNNIIQSSQVKLYFIKILKRENFSSCGHVKTVWQNTSIVFIFEIVCKYPFTLKSWKRYKINDYPLCENCWDSVFF